MRFPGFKVPVSKCPRTGTCSDARPDHSASLLTAAEGVMPCMPASASLRGASAAGALRIESCARRRGLLLPRASRGRSPHGTGNDLDRPEGLVQVWSPGPNSDLRRRCAPGPGAAGGPIDGPGGPAAAESGAREGRARRESAPKKKQTKVRRKLAQKGAGLAAAKPTLIGARALGSPRDRVGLIYKERSPPRGQLTRGLWSVISVEVVCAFPVSKFRFRLSSRQL